MKGCASRSKTVEPGLRYFLNKLQNLKPPTKLKVIAVNSLESPNLSTTSLTPSKASLTLVEFLT